MGSTPYLMELFPTLTVSSATALKFYQCDLCAQLDEAPTPLEPRDWKGDERDLEAQS